MMFARFMMIAIFMALAMLVNVHAEDTADPAVLLETMINSFRTTNGLKPLTSDHFLTKNAKEHTTHMASILTLSQSSPSLQRSLFSNAADGRELLSYRQFISDHSDAQSVLNAWTSGSPKENSPFMSKDLTHIGVAHETAHASEDGKPVTIHYWTAILGKFTA
ncbi:hypothetical protein BDF19DRAFT_428728 [Syncephalis fuscata]|nr:hypothetical protein BDF19DRAFT_428728 [Syncephalis fuscata]